MQGAALRAAALLAAAAVAAAGTCVVDDNTIGAAANCIDANSDTACTMPACAIALNWNTSGLVDGISAKSGVAPFNGRNLTLQNIGDWDMSGVRTLTNAFYNCALSPSTDLGRWDVSSVTSFYYAFYYGTNPADNTMYTNLHIGNWTITSETTDMALAFFGRTNFLTTDDVGGWDVSSVTTFDGTFGFNSFFAGNGLEQWAVSSEAQNMGSMFWNCNLTDVDLGGWNVSSVTTFKYTFHGNEFFVGNGLDQWAVSSNATTISSMLYGCNLGAVDVSGWDVSSVTTFEYTFGENEFFVGNGLDQWAVSSNATTISSMLYGCNLGAVDVGGWDVSMVTEMSYGFRDNINFVGNGLDAWQLNNETLFKNNAFELLAGTSVPTLPAWDVASRLSTPEQRDVFWATIFGSNDNSLGGVPFAQGPDCTVTNENIKVAATCIDSNVDRCAMPQCDDATNWDTAAVTDMTDAFKDKNLTLQDISGWDMSGVTTLYSAFRGCLLSPTTNLGSWDVSSVVTFLLAFSIWPVDATDYTDLHIGNWTINSVGPVSMDSAFSGRTNFFVNDDMIGQLDMSAVITLTSAFDNCKLLPTANLGSWNVTAVTNFDYAFNIITNDNTGYTNLNIGNWTINSAGPVTMNAAFNGRTNFFVNDDIGLLNMGAVSSLTQAFRNCLLSITTDLGSWDVSRVTRFNQAFYMRHPNDNTVYGNLNIGNWTITTATTNMYNAFYGRSNFFGNDDVGGWDVSSVTDFENTFNDNYNFAGNGLDKWQIDSGSTLNGMLVDTNVTAMPSSWFAGAADCDAQWRSVFGLTGAETSYNDVAFPTCTVAAAPPGPPGPPAPTVAAAAGDDDSGGNGGKAGVIVGIVGGVIFLPLIIWAIVKLEARRQSSLSAAMSDTLL